ncbi:MAG TPA: hypothetical protein VGK26_06850 [Thermoanaerobaculia bacterium]
MPVRVVVGGPVASVELVLDGKPAGVLQAPFWTGDLPIGSELLPHELLARALGSDGKELARARQWLNLPRPPAEVEVLLERDASGLAKRAAFSWESLTPHGPTSIRATFNGVPLSVSKERSAPLPAYDPEQVQLLSVELEFEDGVRARKDLVLGGRTGEHAETELSAIPIRLADGAKKPSAADLQGRLLQRGEPLAVAAVEQQNGILVVVRDANRLKGLGRWANVAMPVQFRNDLALDPKSVVRFLWPRPKSHRRTDSVVDLFPVSGEFEHAFGGLRWILTRVDNPVPEPRAPRYADAVAVAGLHAFGTFRRRAVLLVMDANTIDASEVSADRVGRFLESLRVPLFVWSIGAPVGPTAAWDGAVDVTSENALRDSFKKLRAELDSQWIVWVEGKVLPQEVTLAPGATAGGIELVP